MYFVYVDHLYNVAYIMEDIKDYEDLYCETCGDSDTLLEVFETMNEAIECKIKYNRGEW